MSRSNRILTLDPFVSYQDMLDGEVFPCEYSDIESDDEYDTYEAGVEDTREDTATEDDEDDDDREDPATEDDEDHRWLRQSSAIEEDIISLIGDLFNYTKRLRQSQRKLKRTILEMKQTIADFQDQLDTFIQPTNH